MTTTTDLICPKDIVDPETGEIYFAKGARVTEEALIDRLANTVLLKKRSHKLSGVYNDLKDLYSEYVAHHEPIEHEGYYARLRSGGMERTFDLATLADAHQEQLLRMASEGMLQIKTARVKDALELPYVRGYMEERPRTQPIDIDRERN